MLSWRTDQAVPVAAALRVQLEQTQAEAQRSPQVRRLVGLVARLKAAWRG
jgi:hypothetical protein